MSGVIGFGVSGDVGTIVIRVRVFGIFVYIVA